ncbi:hypothetical protein [Marinomonas sp.]
MSSVVMLVFVDYSPFSEQRLPYSLRRGHLLISLCSWINNR